MYLAHTNGHLAMDKLVFFYLQLLSSWCSSAFSGYQTGPMTVNWLRSEARPGSPITDWNHESTRPARERPISSDCATRSHRRIVRSIKMCAWNRLLGLSSSVNSVYQCLMKCWTTPSGLNFVEYSGYEKCSRITNSLQSTEFVEGFCRSATPKRVL